LASPPIYFSPNLSRHSRERSLVILQEKVAGVTPAAIKKFLTRARRAAGLTGHVNVLLTSNAQIRSLNRQFRRNDKATDVLSFPAPTASFDGDGSDFAGDIAISAEIAAENATRFGHSVGEEIKILILHGILHLAGFDHESDNGIMARKEAQLRQALNLPPALIERVHSDKPYTTKKKPKPHRAGAATV
jgi:probable rRNA maturation factor